MPRQIRPPSSGYIYDEATINNLIQGRWDDQTSQFIQTAVGTSGWTISTLSFSGGYIASGFDIPSSGLLWGLFRCDDGRVKMVYVQGPAT